MVPVVAATKEFVTPEGAKQLTGVNRIVRIEDAEIVVPPNPPLILRAYNSSPATVAGEELVTIGDAGNGQFPFAG